MLTEIQISNNNYYLNKQIDQIESELNAFVDSPESLPELVTSANLLRLNEFLMKSDNKKTELISAYSKYSKTMEVLLLSVFEIQNELKDILKQQSSLISSKPKPKPKTKPKPKPKPWPSKPKPKPKPTPKPKPKPKP